MASENFEKAVERATGRPIEKLVDTPHLPRSNNSPVFRLNDASSHEAAEKAYQEAVRPDSVDLELDSDALRYASSFAGRHPGLVYAGKVLAGVASASIVAGILFYNGCQAVCEGLGAFRS